MELAAELEASLREFAATGSAELRENGGRLAPFTGLSWEVRGSGDKPLLHIWSEQYNLTRRVLGITNHSDDRLTLAVERFGRSKPDRLELVRTDFERPARQLSREEFAERLKNILATQFPDEGLESITVAADLEHSLSGNYARGILRRGSVRTPFLAVPDGESAETLHNSLTFLLLWNDRVCASNLRGTIGGPRLLLPKNAGGTVAHRCLAIDPKVGLELFERDAARETLEKINPRHAGNVESSLVRWRDSEMLLDLARPEVGSIVSLSPQAISVHPVPASGEVWLRFRGLGFGYWDEGRVFYGIGDQRTELSKATRPGFARLLHDLEVFRHPLASDTRHTLYRAQPERWLESIVRADVSRIDPLLNPRYVYPQVVARAGGDHGILDLLTVTRAGRLAILELKASEHIHLPLQAADYWLHVRRHLESGNLQASGYFPGLKLQALPPLIYLVAPALRFHPSSEILQRYVAKEMQFERVGVTESWRRGLRVVMRH